MTENKVMSHIKAANNVISEQQAVIRKFASELNDMRKLSGGIELDVVALRKVAHDVHTLYGSPSNVKEEQLVELWKSDPNTLVGAMQKLASAHLAQLATGNHIGAPARDNDAWQNVSSKSEELDADTMFRQKYE